MSETAVVWSEKTGVGSSGSLSVTSSGQISFLNASSGQNLWPKNATAAYGSAQLVLRNDGNLIFGSSWESFNFPTDTFLPNQTMNGTQITSANGRFSLSSGALIFNNTEVYWPSGTVGSFLMLNDLGRIDLENQSPILSPDLGDSLLRRLTLDNDGNLRMLSHRDDQWTMVLQSKPELCRIHGSYGRNSICMSDGGTSTNCILPARIPIRRRRTLPLRSQAPDPDKTVFLRLDYVNFTGGSNQTDIKSENFADCRDKCLSRPTCLGFMFKYDGSRYYVLQIDNLLFGYWSPGTEFSEEFNATRRNIAIIVTLFAAELFSVIVFFWVFLKKYIKYRNMAQTLALELLPTGGPKRFTFAETKAATNGFTDPIGKGGFGDVYKGELPDKRVVAVKCLKSVAGRSSGPRSRSSPGCTI